MEKPPIRPSMASSSGTRRRRSSGLLGPVQEGRIYAFVGGKRYKITPLESDGKFTLEADF